MHTVISLPNWQFPFGYTTLGEAVLPVSLSVKSEVGTFQRSSLQTVDHDTLVSQEMGNYGSALHIASNILFSQSYMSALCTERGKGGTTDRWGEEERECVCVRERDYQLIMDNVFFTTDCGFKMSQKHCPQLEPLLPLKLSHLSWQPSCSFGVVNVSGQYCEVAGIKTVKE